MIQKENSLSPRHFFQEGAGMASARVSGFKLEPFLMKSIHGQFGVGKFLVVCLYYLDPGMSEWDQKRCSELGYPQFTKVTPQSSDLRVWDPN